ncbi:MAG: hypothetical protein Q4E89_00610 [Eubacteriales bacterium]|nr:hypothetical protein [Eubacteriales bacterium]
MLHILWIILKCILVIIGVVLGLTLGILLLFLLLLLFCPVRYQALVKKWDKQIQGNAKVSWLFGALSLSVGYEIGGSPQIGIQIFGVSLDKLRSLLKKREGRKQKPKEKKKEERLAPPDGNKSKELVQREEQEKQRVTEPEDSDLEKSDVHAEDSPKNPEPKRTHEEKKQAALPGQRADEAEKKSAEDFKQTRGEAEKASESAREKPRQTWYERLVGNIRKILYRIKKLWQKLCAFVRTLVSSAQKTQEKVQELRRRIARWKHFLEEEHTRKALALIKKHGKRVFLHLLPTELSGHVTLGLEEPSQMGAVLAVLGMTMPFHKNCIAVTPVYDRNMLEGEVALKGRVYGFVLVWVVLRLWFDKNITYVRKHWRNKEE